jgi:hypothetical protein
MLRLKSEADTGVDLMTLHRLAAGNIRRDIVGSKKRMPRNRPGLFVMTGGLLQIVLSLCVLFLPVFATCGPQSGATTCERKSYIDMGGSAVGHGFLVLMIAVGVMAIVSTRIENPVHVCQLRWLGVIASASFVIIAGWSIGFLFLPGALFLLVAALACRQRTYAAQ